MTEEVKDNVEETAPAQSETAMNAEQGQAGPELNINDLVSIKSIIDIASQRGAFKANELEAVGKTYNRLNTFIETVTSKEQ